MSTKMQLTTKLSQQLVMSQQLRQAITLLQYNTTELKQIVTQFIESNPLIEVEEVENVSLDEAENSTSDDYDYFDESRHGSNTSKNYQSHQDDSSLENYTVAETLREHLLEQTLLCKFNHIEQLVAESIIDAIDDTGLISMSIEEIQQMIDPKHEIPIALFYEILTLVQTFDPLGVAARNVQECLLIQLTQLSKNQEQDQTWEIAREILTKHFELVSTNNAKKIIKILHVEQQQYAEAMALIRTLNPRPGLKFSNDMLVNIEPELYVKKIKNTWKVFLTNHFYSNIKINRQYQEMIKQSKGHESYDSLKRELQEAQWLLKGLSKRNETLLSVANYIVKLQKEFLELGPAHMKPMNIIDVSSALNIHESTVSRITNGKHLLTPWGVMELKIFFPSYVSTESGTNCSDTTVKEYIKEIISQESATHIHSDEDIARLLKERGINIARRTVAKYREAMKILPSYQRAQMQFNHTT